MSKTNSAVNRDRNNNNGVDESLFGEIDVTKTLRCLQRELQTLKQQNKDLKYQIVMLHSDPNNSLDQDEQHHQSELEKELEHMRKTVRLLSQNLEEARIKQHRLEEENVYLKSTMEMAEHSLVNLRDQWKQQNAHIVALQSENDTLKHHRHKRMAANHSGLPTFQEQLDMARHHSLRQSLPGRVPRKNALSMDAHSVKYEERPMRLLPAIQARQASKEYYSRFK
eukprot:m.103269 g.103269  ORF g.103269 m.103269 type:complete len:224 (+) comp9090_c0_seq3:77-748(+)